MKKLSLLAAALLFSSSALALDGVFVELGNGDATDMGRIGATWDWNKSWLSTGNWHVTGYWEASLGLWDGHSDKGDNQAVTDIGFTPVFRFEQKQPGSFAPYVEGAIGFHLISDTYINADRRFSTAFQFGDHIGLGVEFGDKKQFDLAYRYQHLSNGGIKKPNQGINFNQIRFAYQF